MRRSILIIAPHIPAYDTNAGDWRVWVLVKELSKKYDVYFCPIDNKANLKYKPALKKYIKQFAPITAAGGFDAVIFEKYFGIDYSKCLRRFLTIPNLIIDTHDIGYLKAERAGDKNWQKIKNNETALYKMARTLIAISDFDRGLLPGNKHVIVIPTPSENKLKKFPPYEKRKGIALWGYWNYPANADALKYFSKEIAPLLSPDIPVSVLGYGSAKENIKNIQSELSKYRVTAVPLRWGSGVKKKIIDSFSAQTPVVTTPVGAEGINISKSAVCLNAKSFAKILVNVYNDKKLWQKHSRHGYKLFVENYTMANFRKSLKRLYKAIGR